jgi:hypothetical protein
MDYMGNDKGVNELPGGPSGFLSGPVCSIFLEFYAVEPT